MARKRTRKKQSTDLVSVESSVKKLQSLLVHPDISTWIYSGAASGVRSKLLAINYDLLRNIVHRIPLVNAIINTRIDQTMPFCKRVTERDEKGYSLNVVKGVKENEKTTDELYKFIDQTGFQYSAEREDDFADYVQQIIREILTIDQIATELQINRLGEAVAFWALDGSKIFRTTEESPYSKNVRFVQMVDEKVYNTYTDKTMIFDYKNKRVDLRYRGFGYSCVEMAIDVVTTLLFGYKYLSDLFIKDKIPKGFIAVMGDADKTQLDAIREYWYAAMSGYGGRWNIPILPSGKEGVGIDFKNIGQSNRDMEYHKLMMYVSSILAAVFSIDLAELGIKTDDSQAIIGESGKPRIEASKDRGLGSLLSFLEQHINKILKKITSDYVFSFTGFEPNDESKRVEIDQKHLHTDTTINELRESQGKEKLPHEYADHILDPQAVQMHNATKMQQQMGGEGEGDEFGEEGEEGEEEDFGSMFKSKTVRKKKAVKITIQ